MPSLATYIAFPGNAKEAFELYRDIFGGELMLLTYADAPMEGMPFTPDPASVAHASLSLPGGVIAGGDAMPAAAPDAADGRKLPRRRAPSCAPAPSAPCGSAPITNMASGWAGWSMIEPAATI